MIDSFAFLGVHKMRFLLLVSACLLGVGCSAQQYNQASVPKVPTLAKSKKEVVVPLDPSGKDMKVKVFQSGQELLKEVDRLGGVRGEYETDTAFFGRLSKLGNYSVAGVVFPSSLNFNAVTGDFVLTASMQDAKGFGFVSNLDLLQSYKVIYPSFYLGESDYRGAQYSGQNSFGATTVVTKRTIDRYYLVFSPVPKSELSTLFFNVTSKLNVSADEVKRERENIRLLFTVKSVPNYLQVTKSYQEPTLQNPFESVINSYFFSSKIFWVKVVNIKTGKIYSEKARISISAL